MLWFGRVRKWVVFIRWKNIKEQGFDFDSDSDSDSVSFGVRGFFPGKRRTIARVS